MSNPFKPHAQNLFSQRDTIDEAMAYAHQLINALDASDRIAALTALMVVINTAAKVWPVAPAAGDIAQVQADLDSRLVALANRVSDLEVHLNGATLTPLTNEYIAKVARESVSEWADDSFNDLADDWLRNHADLDDSIQNWMENNMDVENEVREVLSSANLSITF